MTGFKKTSDFPFFIKKWDPFLALLSLKERKERPIVGMSFFFYTAHGFFETKAKKQNF
jgi:hypothetical protein